MSKIQEKYKENTPSIKEKTQDSRKNERKHDQEDLDHAIDQEKIKF